MPQLIADDVSDSVEKTMIALLRKILAELEDLNRARHVGATHECSCRYPRNIGGGGGAGATS